MNAKLRRDAETIARKAIEAVKPDEAVRRAHQHVTLGERVYLVAIGTAAWQMAAAPAKVVVTILSDILDDPVDMIASGPAAADPVEKKKQRQLPKNTSESCFRSKAVSGS